MNRLARPVSAICKCRDHMWSCESRCISLWYSKHYPRVPCPGQAAFTVLRKTLELQFGEVTKASAFTPLILVSSQSTQKVPRQTAVQVQDFPWVRTKRSPNNLCMQACTVSREKHQCSHDVNGKRYRYESIFERKGSGGGKSCDQSYQYHGMPRQ